MALIPKISECKESINFCQHYGLMSWILLLKQTFLVYIQFVGFIILEVERELHSVNTLQSIIKASLDLFLLWYSGCYKGTRIQFLKPCSLMECTIIERTVSLLHNCFI